MSLALQKAGIKDNEHKKVARFCEADQTQSPSMTSQAPADEVNINNIMKRVLKGQAVLTSNGTPFYGDVSEFGGLQEAIIKVQEADDLFMQYPADLREKFNNDPTEFVDFMIDPKNKEEAIKLGLIDQPIPAPEPEKEVQPRAVVPPTQ